MTLNDLWISPARINLTKTERNKILSSKKPHITLLSELESRFNSNTFEIGYDDKFLPFLKSSNNFPVIYSLLKNETTFIQERFITSSQDSVENNNSCELVIPFTFSSNINKKNNYNQTSKHIFSNYAFKSFHQYLNNWLSFKIYCSPMDVDYEILHKITELSKHCIILGYCDKWFFS